MDYSIHDNGWTVIIDPKFKIKNATQDDINLIARLISKYTVVVLKNQELTVAEEDRIISMFKDPETRQYLTNYESEKLLNRLYVPDSNKIIRVTGELDEHGEPGLFGHATDLDWHCNHSANPWRHPIVWLYSVKGSKGSKTSWLNHILAYNDLSNEDKEYYKTIKTINGYKAGSYSPHVFGKPVDINYTWTPDLVHTSHAGVTGLFFPFLQIHQIVGMSEDQSKEFISKLRKHVEQEKYMYHHIWDDGDINMSDQWFGIHKRWAFKDIDQRVLHRAVMRYPDQDYS